MCPHLLIDGVVAFRRSAGATAPLARLAAGNGSASQCTRRVRICLPRDLLIWTLGNARAQTPPEQLPGSSETNDFCTHRNLETSICPLRPLVVDSNNSKIETPRSNSLIPKCSDHCISLTKRSTQQTTKPVSHDLNFELV